MNNDFLSNFRRSPRPEFAQSLYAKLMQDAKAKPMISRHLIAKRITFALAALCLAFALTIALSPTIRAAALAAMDNIIAKITVRGVTVLVVDEPSPAPTTEGSESNESYAEVWTPLSPADISADYPFFAKLPTWVPSGYTLQKRAALYYTSILETPPSSAVFEWINDSGETIQLLVLRGSCPNGPLYDANGPMHDYRSDCAIAAWFIVELKSKPQVVEINGQPAVLFSGVFGLADLSGPVKKWNPSRGKSTTNVTKGATMIWESDGRTFWLTSTAITKEDLIRLAETIP